MVGEEGERFVEFFELFFFYFVIKKKEKRKKDRENGSEIFL